MNEGKEIWIDWKTEARIALDNCPQESAKDSDCAQDFD